MIKKIFITFFLFFHRLFSINIEDNPIQEYSKNFAKIKKKIIKNRKKQLRNKRRNQLRNNKKSPNYFKKFKYKYKTIINSLEFEMALTVIKDNKKLVITFLIIPIIFLIKLWKKNPLNLMIKDIKEKKDIYKLEQLKFSANDILKKIEFSFDGKNNEHSNNPDSFKRKLYNSLETLNQNLFNKKNKLNYKDQIGYSYDKSNSNYFDISLEYKYVSGSLLDFTNDNNLSDFNSILIFRIYQLIFLETYYKIKDIQENFDNNKDNKYNSQFFFSVLNQQYHHKLTKIKNIYSRSKVFQWFHEDYKQNIFSTTLKTINLRPIGSIKNLNDFNNLLLNLKNEIQINDREKLKAIGLNENSVLLLDDYLWKVAVTCFLNSKKS
jgi:hypothetical protein